MGCYVARIGLNIKHKHKIAQSVTTTYDDWSEVSNRKCYYIGGIRRQRSVKFLQRRSQTSALTNLKIIATW